MAEQYHSTAEFGRLDRGYAKHCGPTAVTNLLLSLLGRDAPAPERLFRDVARLGRRRLIYANWDWKGPLGGTSDLRSREYLRAALDRYGLKEVRVGRVRLLTPTAVRDALRRGSVLYLQLLRHPKYGSHHLLCYGLEPDGRVRLADGWAASPVLLEPKALGRGLFLEVHPL